MEFLKRSLSVSNDVTNLSAYYKNDNQQDQLQDKNKENEPESLNSKMLKKQEIQQLKDEKEQLERQIEESKVEVDYWKNKYSASQNQLKDSQTKQLENIAQKENFQQDYKKIFDQFNNKMQNENINTEFKKILTFHEEQMKSMKQTSNEQMEIVKMSAENLALKDSEIAALRQRVEYLQGENLKLLKSKQQVFKELKQTINQLQHETALQEKDIKQKNDELQQVEDLFASEQKELKAQVEYLRNQNKELTKQFGKYPEEILKNGQQANEINTEAIDKIFQNEKKQRLMFLYKLGLQICPNFVRVNQKRVDMNMQSKDMDFQDMNKLINSFEIQLMLDTEKGANHNNELNKITHLAGDVGQMVILVQQYQAIITTLQRSNDQLLEETKKMDLLTSPLDKNPDIQQKIKAYKEILEGRNTLQQIKVKNYYDYYLCCKTKQNIQVMLHFKNQNKYQIEERHQIKVINLIHQLQSILLELDKNFSEQLQDTFGDIIIMQERFRLIIMKFSEEFKIKADEIFSTKLLSEHAMEQDYEKNEVVDLKPFISPLDGYFVIRMLKLVNIAKIKPDPVVFITMKIGKIEIRSKRVTIKSPTFSTENYQITVNQELFNDLNLIIDLHDGENDQILASKQLNILKCVNNIGFQHMIIENFDVTGSQDIKHTFTKIHFEIQYISNKPHYLVPVKYQSKILSSQIQNYLPSDGILFIQLQESNKIYEFEQFDKRIICLALQYENEPQIKFREQSEQIKQSIEKQIQISTEEQIPKFKIIVTDETYSDITLLGDTGLIDISLNIVNPGKWIYYVKNLLNGKSKGFLKFKVQFVNHQFRPKKFKLDYEKISSKYELPPVIEEKQATINQKLFPIQGEFIIKVLEGNDIQSTQDFQNVYMRINFMGKKQDTDYSKNNDKLVINQSYHFTNIVFQNNKEVVGPYIEMWYKSSFQVYYFLGCITDINIDNIVSNPNINHKVTYDFETSQKYADVQNVTGRLQLELIFISKNQVTIDDGLIHKDEEKIKNLLKRNSKLLVQ